MLDFLPFCVGLNIGFSQTFYAPDATINGFPKASAHIESINGTGYSAGLTLMDKGCFRSIFRKELERYHEKLKLEQREFTPAVEEVQK